MKSLIQAHPIMKIIDGVAVSLPVPSSLTRMWNFGSLLGLCLVTQIATGLFLAIHYSCDISLAFERVSHIRLDVNNGWLLRIFHANGARFFLSVFIYIFPGVSITGRST